MSEFNRWSPIDEPTLDYQRPYQLYILNETSKKSSQRTQTVQNWFQTGGVLVIGYEMFRLLTTTKRATSSMSQSSIKTQRLFNAYSPLTPVSVDNDDDEKNIDTTEGM